ncbi:MAG: sigma-54-dependent Fis family transcriptional regulator [Desulfuromonas sp.]|nr:MAG: sigma-54-dependent Fis family transcriptional regulator [Desulfuromonas sp.]
MAQILIVDDEEKIRVILRFLLETAKHKVIEAAHGKEALALLENEAVDLVLSDVRMNEMDGFSLLEAIRDQELGCPVIFVTAFATLESAVQALRLGASDYLVKPFEEEAVLLAVERALGMRRLLAENIRLKQAFAENVKGSPVVVASPSMQQVRDLGLKVAGSEATVLLSGESGTGKEVMARFIHQTSPRSGERYVAVNCAAIAPSLLEAELFGHEKGSFTGADKARAGKFEFAAGGTLFLDEIGEMPLEAQSKLLRAIQEKSIQRVGGNQEIPISCRLVCATNRDLAQQVREGAFREDLYYRLAVFPIHMPPLRERKADIVPLARFYIEKTAGRSDSEVLTPAAQRLLQGYTWPGNVRELFNVLERAMIMKGGELPLSSDDFPHVSGQAPAALGAAGDQLYRLPPQGVDFEELQRSIVLQAMEMTMGNQSAAARLLNVSRARFRTLLGLITDENGRIRIENRNLSVER